MKTNKMETEQCEADSWPRKEEAKEYLEKHKVIELFNNLTSQLIYNKPSNPKEFMVEQLEKLSKSRASRLDYPCLFDEANIQSVFGMMDPTARGYITLEQYKQAMVGLGISGFDPNPTGGDIDRITFDIFSRDAKLGLSRSSATFSDKK